MSESPVTRAWTPSPGPALPHGPAILGFEILEELGRGGMGVVYKARQNSTQRLVALKVIRDSALAGPQQRARFRIEAEAASRMRHPNVVEIFEVGEHDGQPYYAMELVEGGSLERLLARQPPSASAAAKLVRSLALAVQHAHVQKIVHRDLKPANVLLSTTDQVDMPPVPKIADFGLAKRLDCESTAWTQAGAVVGTANYMAPEQAAGSVGEIGPAVDVYALGAILYEMLAGRPPFQADSWGQTVGRVLHDEPALPTRLQTHVPRDLETICLKCLEKQPARRYSSAEELADDLARFLAGQSISATPLDARERLTRLLARDGYQLLDEIGRGPGAVVYSARYGPLKQTVVLKVFEPGRCTREHWESRLRRSAELWAALSHPHLVPVQRHGWLDDSPYLVVEHVPQGSLASSLAGRPSAIPQALRLIEQLAEVVSYLHRQGVVHGNLKPGNVLLAADGIPRLVDLHPTGGLFQSLLPPHDAAPIGLGYLAPEFVENPHTEPRPNTDIYGLGLILYELLTGRPAFVAATAGDAIEQVRSHDPLPPSRLNPFVTSRLDALCLRCLQKNPWRRPMRVYDLSRHVRYLLENPSDLALPGEGRPKRRPFGRDGS